MKNVEVGARDRMSKSTIGRDVQRKRKRIIKHDARSVALVELEGKRLL